MLPMSWNGSNGAVHFLVTTARKSLTVCACAPVARNASAHSAAVNFFMVCLPGLFLQVVLADCSCRLDRARPSRGRPASYVVRGAAATATCLKKFVACAE